MVVQVFTSVWFLISPHPLKAKRKVGEGIFERNLLNERKEVGIRETVL
jgi:hypothetical protein